MIIISAKIYHDIGLLYISEKLYKSAGECFEQSLRCLERTDKKDKYLHATILQNIGAVYNYMRDYKKAITFHRRAVDIYGKISNYISKVTLKVTVFANRYFCGICFRD